jgi:hypothetical protein
MNGPAHYRQARQLLEHAAAMLGTDVAPEDNAELLAAAAAIGLSAHLDRASAGLAAVAQPPARRRVVAIGRS